MCPPPLVSEGRGPHLGAQQASWASVGEAIALLSCPAPPVWEGPSYVPLLISLASLLCPQDPRSLDGTLGVGNGLGAQQAPWPKWARRSPSASLPLFPESPSRLPLLISPALGVPILSGLHFSSPPQYPLHPTGSLWGSSHLLGHQSPPPAAGRHPSCGQMLTPRLLTLPS